MAAIDDCVVGEIIYRVELPDMEQITLIYLENNDGEDYCKCVFCGAGCAAAGHVPFPFS